MKRKLSGLLSVIMLTVLCFGNYAMAATSGNYTYTVSNGTATITACSKSASGHIEIPDVLGGCTVTEIGAAAFANCTLITSVAIPSSVTTMGENVFEGCSNLVSVKLPGTVRTIPHYAFRKCKNLENINLENVYVVGIESFKDCSILKEVDLSSTSWVRRRAFYYCKELTSVKNMNSVTEISDYAFSNCIALKEITLPAKLKTFGSSVFTASTALENIYVQDGSSYFKDVDGVLYTADGTGLYAVPPAKSGTLVVEPGTTRIYTEAAYMNSNLKEVILPETVTIMNSRCFAMTGINKFVIPRSISTLGNTVVGTCSNLTELYAPSTITDTESSWNGSGTAATFYDYVITYTDGDEIVDKEYVLAGGNATAPVDQAELYNFTDKNGETWTGENITADTYVIRSEKYVPSGNANLATCEYSYYSADGVDNIVAIEKWEQDENGDYVYNGTVPADAKVSVTATAEDENATVEVGDIYYGEDTIKTYIDVKAEDGTVQSYYIYLTIEVPAVEIVAVSELDEIVVDYGSAFALPNTVNVELSTGDTMDVPVTWNSDVIDTTVATTYSIIGTIELPEDITNPNGLAAYLYVTVKDKELSSNTNVTVQYSYGAEYITVEDWEVYGVENWYYATIPADTEYTKLDATPEDENTTVDITTTAGENGEEIYNIVVTAEDGTRAFYYVSLAKEVAEITVESIIELEPFVLEYGSDDELLYEAVEVVFSNGETQYVSVKWNTDEYNTYEPGEYKVSGELLLGEGYSNPNGLMAYVTVIVNEKYVPSSNANLASCNISYYYPTENRDNILIEKWEQDAAGYYVYHQTIPAQTRILDITAVAEDESAEVLTSRTSNDSTHCIEIVVTAEDGASKTYRVYLTEEAADVEIVSVAECEEITVDYGMGIDGIIFPETVNVELSTGETMDVPVTWNVDVIDTTVATTYSIIGTLELPEDITNPNDLTAYLYVTVKDKVLSGNTNVTVQYSYGAEYITVEDWEVYGVENWYYATIPADTEYTKLDATPEDENTTVDITTTAGENGEEIYNIVVTAEDGTRAFYYVSLAKEIAIREIVEIPSVSEIWVNQGDSEWAMNLPETVEVKLSDGEYVTLYVEWVGEVDYYTPNTYTLSGYVAIDEENITNPDELLAEINVIVEAIPVPAEQVITGMYTLEDVSIDEGVSVEAVLPDMMTVILESGMEAEVPVMWDTANFDYTIYNTVQTICGDFITDGTDITNPHGFRAQINVSIYREEPTVKEIIGVHDLDELGTFYIEYGADLTNVDFPKTITVDLDDGTTIDLEVIWTLSRVNTTKPGHVSIPGQLVLIDGISNSANYAVVLSAEVMEKPLPKVTQVLSCSDVVAYVGTEVTASALGLPTQVQLVLDDGNMLTVPVEWNIDEVTTDETGYYPLEGTLNLDGYEAENPDELKAYVNLDIFEKPEVDLSLASIKYTLNNVEYEITAADKTAETEWTVYIPEDEWTATMSISVSAEATDAANAEVVISQPTSITSAGTQAVINVTAVDSEESVNYTIYFKPKARTWNVTFMSNGETVSTQTIKDGYPAYNPGPLDGDGKEFAGWDRDFSCVTSDMTVNALYEEINDDEWSFWYIEKIDDIVVDSTMTIATLRAILPTQAWVWYRRGAETMCIPAAIEWEIPDDFFALGADTRLLVAKIITSPTGAYPIDANVNAEVNIIFAGAGESTTRYIISVSRPADVAVPYNATVAEMAAVLPKTVSVTLDNGSIQNMNVEWDLSTVILTQAGTYEIMGGIFHGTDVQNPGEHKAKMNVIVNEKLTANGALRAEEITATPGEEITVRITADENLNMAIGSFMLDFDRTMLELVDYEIGGLIGGSNPMVNESYDDNGIEKVYVSFMGLDNITAGGEVITLKLKVSENAADDMHYPIHIQNVKFYDFNENRVEVDEVDGDVHVLHYMTGDVNNNGMVELLDAFRVLQYDVGLREFSKAEMLAADVNADASVNILDALLIQEYDAGLITEF